MKVIIPVAGVGSRLRPHTFSTPKVLLHVAGRPILSHVLEPIVRLHPEEVIFVIGFRGSDIREYVESSFTFKSRFVQQDKLLGLGYAVSLAMEHVDGGPVLIVLGDTIVQCDLEKFVAAGDFVLGLRQVDDPHRFGIAEVKGGHVVAVEEKPTNPKTNMAVIGLYYFKDSRNVTRALHAHVASGKTTRGEIQFTDALQLMIEDGVRFVPFEVTEWFDCGKKETILDTNRHLLERINQPVTIAGTTIIPPVFISESAVVKHSVIGPYVSISEGAVVEACILKDSIVGPHARIQNVVLEDSLLGHHVVIKGTGKRLNVGDSSEIIIT
jgi:glucose-1-phosphate thymidylyltransferase